MESAVLADIQDRHVETKGTQKAQERIKLRAGDATGADFDQGLAQEQQVSDDALGRMMLTGTQLAFGVRQAKTRQVDILTPGLTDVATDGVRTGFAMGGGMLGDLTQEYRRRLLQMIAQGETLPEGLEAFIANCDSGGAEEI
jgi:hypothetical protein